MSAAAVAAALAVAALTPLWHVCGRGAQHLQLPAITGIMLAGVASGPYGLGLLSGAGVASLSPLVHACLSLIALAAGAELHLPELQRLRKQVACLTGAISFCSWAMVYICMRLLSGSLPFVQPLAAPHVTAVCTLASTLAVARSPASLIAVLKELEGKGTYCSLVAAVVVVKDVVLFAAFAINVELARALVGRHEMGGASLLLLLQPAAAIMLSVGLGGLAGYLLSKLLRLCHAGTATLHQHTHPHSPAADARHALGGNSGRLPAPVARLLRHPFAARLRPAVPLLVGASTFAAAEVLGGEPLLTCVAAGLVASNWRQDQKEGRDASELLSADLARLAPLTNALFFGLVGASLKLRAVRDSLWAAAILYVVRLAGVWLGCWLGAGAGGTPPDVGQRLWMGMITQAGIALGLAQSVAARFPTWGPDFAAMWAGVVMMNLLTGPPLFKAAIIASGEAKLQGGKAGEQLIGGGEPVGGERTGLPTASVPVIPIINA